MISSYFVNGNQYCIIHVSIFEKKIFTQYIAYKRIFCIFAKIIASKYQ